MSYIYHLLIAMVERDSERGEQNMKARILVRYSLLLAVVAGACMASAQSNAQSNWTTVVNNGSVMPGS
ncbi:MAG: hypothetical protein RB191_05970, partial [Terriglobia bacterium]|nr:hypothetical protein [Terriglobia bacterium]